MNPIRYILPFICILASAGLSAQRRVSADIETKQVIGKNVITITKSVYCTNNGRLVIWVHTPQEYYIVTNALGEARLYLPSSHEVMTDRSGALSSGEELLSLFLFGRMDDLGASLDGYALSGTGFDEGLLKKTFTNRKNELVPTMEVVYKDYLPIYSSHLNPSGEAVSKSYYSHYRYLPNFVFPERVTSITYGAKNDSTVVRNIYSNIVVDGNDPMFDFEIPSDAKEAAAPGQVMKK